MVMNDPLSNMMSNLYNAEKRFQNMVLVKPSSKIITKVLQILKDNNYIAEFKEQETNRGNYVKIKLNNQINKCGVIKPRFSVKNDEFEKYEKRYLLAKDFGIIIVSTTDGLMDHKQAKEKGLGGRLIAYCY